jgi:hypothetical protein
LKALGQQIRTIGSNDTQGYLDVIIFHSLDEEGRQRAYAPTKKKTTGYHYNVTVADVLYYVA